MYFRPERLSARNQEVYLRVAHLPVQTLSLFAWPSCCIGKATVSGSEGVEAVDGSPLLDINLIPANWTALRGGQRSVGSTGPWKAKPSQVKLIIRKTGVEKITGKIYSKNWCCSYKYRIRQLSEEGIGSDIDEAKNRFRKEACRKVI